MTMKQIILLLLSFSAIYILTITISTTAQEAPPCPAELSCPEIVLPEVMTGEFVLNDVVLAAGNRATLQIPAGQQQIIVRNIQSTEQGFNQLFVYDPVTVNVSLRAGQTRTFNAAPHKTFIRGTLNFTCQIANVHEGEDARCLVIVDGVPLGEVQPGQQAQFILDPGPRALLAQIVGASADLWLPNTWESSSNIAAGRTTNARSQFSKRAKLTLTTSVEGAVGDFYIDDQLIAAQVPSVEQFLAAGTHTVAVRNISDPSSAGLYHWSDVTTSTTLRAGEERALVLRSQTNMTFRGIVQSADPNLCVGTTSEQVAIQSWNSSLANTVSCLHNVLVWESDAAQQQALRRGRGLCQIQPQPSELESYFADYWALADVATVYFNLGQRLNEAGKTALAREAFQVILDRYSCSWAWDPRGWFWSLSVGAQEQLSTLH